MIKKTLILFFAILFMSVNYAGMCFAEYEEIQEDEIVKAQAAYKQGVAYTRIKEYDNAVASFQKALSFYPEMTDAYYNIASIYIAQNKVDDAYNIYTKILAINPNDYDAILQAAKISYNRKNYALAIKYLKYIPDDYEKYYIAQQMYNDALELFDKQKNQYERSKVSSANKNKTVVIDKFNSPAGVAVDSDGNIFVVSYSDNAIIKVDKKKQKTNFVKDYLLDGPVGLAIDKYDNLYVSNYDGGNILKITKGGSVSVFMDKVSKPYFLGIKDDILYITEQGNDVVITYNLAM